MNRQKKRSPAGVRERLQNLGAVHVTGAQLNPSDTRLPDGMPSRWGTQGRFWIFTTAEGESWILHAEPFSSDFLQRQSEIFDLIKDLDLRPGLTVQIGEKTLIDLAFVAARQHNPDFGMEYEEV